MQDETLRFAAAKLGQPGEIGSDCHYLRSKQKNYIDPGDNLVSSALPLIALS
jgi:hypothetical protein